MALVRRKNGSPLVVAGKLSGVLVDNVIKANDPNLDFFQIEVDTTLSGATASDQFACWTYQAGPSIVCDIGWGDGNWQVSGTADGEIHTYAAPGAYTVRCIGNQRWRFINGSPYADQGKVTQINRFGYYNNCTFLYNAFQGASIDGPLLSIDTLNPSLSHILNDFFGSTGLTNVPASFTLQGLNVNVESMFENNPNLDFDVANITGTLNKVADMFKNCTTFNNNGSTSINNLNVVSTDMDEVFANAVSFNQPVGSWNVSASQDFTQCFYRADIFNQDLGSWDVSNATGMSQIFREAHAFNNGGIVSAGTGLDTWDVAKVTNLGYAFYLCYTFNADISSWNVAKVTVFSTCFRSTSFNNNGVGGPGVGIDSWDVSSCGDFSAMFASSPFNHTLNSWNIRPSDIASTNTAVNTNELIDTGVDFVASGITNQFKVRNEATGDVANVTAIATNVLTLSADIFPSSSVSYEVFKSINMSSVFQYNSSFNGEISNWEMKNVSNLSGFLQVNANNGTFNNGGVNTGAGVGIDTWRFKYPLSMNLAFQGQVNFNCFINNWNFDKVTSFQNTFTHCDVFNQPINNIDFSGVTSGCGVMFRYNYVMNQPFNGGTGWGNTTSGVTVFNYAFAQCYVWNQPWTGDLGNCNNIGGMISNAYAFNGGQASGIRSRDVRWILPSAPSGGGTMDWTSFAYGANSWAQDMESDGTYWEMTAMRNASGAFFNTKINQDLSSWALKSVAVLTSAFGSSQIISFYNICKTLPGWVSNVPNTGCNASTIFNNRIISKTQAESTLTTGTNTSVTSLKLVDTGVNFVTLGVQVGDRVNNTTNGEYAEVTAVAATELDLDFDAFTATSQNYAIIQGYDGMAGYDAYIKLSAPTPASFSLSGTNTSGGTNQLNDTGTDFVAAGVLEGMLVKNTTSGQSTRVAAVAANTLTLDDDYFSSGSQAYTIEGGYGWTLTSALNWT